MILIAGPYRSGTNDDPELMAANVRAMESLALPIFRAGHIPVLGEWFALPLVQLAGSVRVGDDAFNEIFHPISVRLLQKCDAVLRVGGNSAGARYNEGALARQLEAVYAVGMYLISSCKTSRTHSWGGPSACAGLSAPLICNANDPS